MKETLIDKTPNRALRNMQHLIAGADIYDNLSSPEARVYFIDKSGGYYLKYTKAGTFEKGTKMTQYSHFKELGAEVLNYTSNDHDWLLAKAVVGHDCIDSEYLNHPKRLYDMIVTRLKELHEIDYSDYPVTNRTAEYLAKAGNNYRTGNYNKSSSPNSFGYHSAEQAHEVLAAGEGALQSQVLLHGDYCLPNIILGNWESSGFIDPDCADVGDRHIGLFWGTWTLWSNSKTNQYRNRFLDACGRDRVDEKLLRVIAAAEVSG